MAELQPSTVAVVGAGPVGRVVAGVLGSSGRRVTLCEISPGGRQALLDHGIVLTGAREVVVGPTKIGRVVASVEDLADDPPETIILCVKATANALVADAIAELPGTSTVVSWQNGIDTEQPIAATIGAARVVRAVVNYGVSIGNNGAVTVTFEHPPHYLRELVPEGRERAEAVAGMLSEAGLPTERAEGLVAMVWKKAILNAALNALCGLTGLDMAAATRDSYAWHLADAILIESIAVARANEIWVGAGFYGWAREYLHSAGPHRPSMLADLDAGRRTEIDVINGRIVEYGRIGGVPTPYNQTMLGLVKARESGMGGR